jgi:hypothetical protein
MSAPGRPDRRWKTDERGSMPMAMLIVTIGVSLSAFLAPLVVKQFTNTRTAVNSDTALNAAQSGLDVMMAQVRAAADDKLNGTLEDLPACTLSGDAGTPGTGEKLPYTVTIEYRDVNGTKLTCPTDDVPATAVVTSTGTAPQSSRTLTATYVFSTSNTNIPGGQIRIDTSSAGAMCIDAGPDRTPPAGTRPTMRKCDGSSRQRFGYTADLYLKLVGSEGTGAPNGMCLDSSANRTSSVVVSFSACPQEARVPRFQWSLDGASVFHVTTGTQTADSSWCLNLKTANQAGSNLGLAGCGSSTTMNVFRSDPGVGAGMAGDSTAQMVNYAQFSRCLDLTGHDPGAKYMIAWFCKQAPNGVVEYNQIWTHPVPEKPAVSATGRIILTKSGTPWCLTSPRSTAGYTTVTQCTTANKNSPELQWTVFADTGDYGTSYRVVDTAGLCLQPTDLNITPKDTHSDGTSKVKIEKCSSSELQKWNAPPNINKPTPLIDIFEK